MLATVATGQFIRMHINTVVRDVVGVCACVRQLLSVGCTIETEDHEMRFYKKGETGHH